MTRPVRVLFLDHTAELSGGEIALVELIRHLDRTRVEPIVLLGSHGPLEERVKEHAPVYIIPMDASVVHVRKDALGFKSLINISAIRAALIFLRHLRRFMDEQSIDILHTNSLKASVLGGIAGRLSPLKIVWHIRDRIADDYLPRKVVRVMRRLARILPHFVIGNSSATLRTLQLKNTPSAVIYSGVDLSKFSPSPTKSYAQDAEISSHAKIIGIVGRICPWKGQHVFLEAASRVHVRWPKARFKIIGAALFGEHDYEFDLRRTVQERGLEDVVEFMGFQKNIAGAIHSLDILVHASTVGEPFGQVIVQGMACGKPVIATDGGGVPEIVVDGETGLLVPRNDAAAMADAVCSLLVDEERARKMGVLGHKRVAEQFTIEQSVKTLMTIYERLAGKQPHVDQRDCSSPVVSPYS
jgi:glycosyltransferase involved in cell wall biosynthesis